MLTRVQKWGDNKGVLFPSRILEEAQLSVGDQVDINVERGRIIVEPAPRVRGRYRLQDLVARMPEDYVPQEEDWGEAVGREVW